MSDNEPMSNAPEIAISVTPRRFVEIDHLPALAQLQVMEPSRKPRGLKRWQRKIAQTLYHTIFIKLGMRSNGTLIVTNANGRHAVKIDAGQSVYIDFASRDRYGGYEPAETLLMDALLPKADVFFDVGSNWGYYTLLAATLPGFNGTVFTFDVLPKMNQALSETVQQLGLSNVHVMGFGLSKHSQEVVISRERHAHLTRVVDAPQPSHKIMTGSVKAGDELDLPPPDLIKIDVEDHELAVLQGAVNTIERNRPAILFESRHDGPCAAAAFLIERGYVVYVVHGTSSDRRLVMLRRLEGNGVLSSPANLLAVPHERRENWIGA